MKKRLPIGNDDFAEVRRQNLYFIDKSLMIRDFLDTGDKVTLITRPRRFGKTLNMTMLREFFDITKDSRQLFQGLSIMDTEYASQINSRPVIFLTLKDCKGTTAQEMLLLMKKQIYLEYMRYEKNMKGKLDEASLLAQDFRAMIDVLRDPASLPVLFTDSIRLLCQIIREQYGVPPLLLIDEYDQPVMSSYEYGYHDSVGNFFSNFFGSAMKGNPDLDQALLTEVQRVAKESIFSQFNNVRVYTVLHRQYASYFGFTSSETEKLLKDFGLSLNQKVKGKYDGYLFGGIEIYNPWSLLNYADSGELHGYWVNTSSNYLIKRTLSEADKNFWTDFDRLASGNQIPVWLTLETSYVERGSTYSLWGLLVNSGYLTALERLDENTVIVRIPNDEVMSEFQVLITELGGMDGLELQQMFSCLLHRDTDRFLELYRKIVISCTSYLDAKENAYHMLFLGMCMTMRGSYKVTSNLESGYGRSDITLESLHRKNPHVIIEFKQGTDLDRLKNEALEQILEKKYYAPLKGEILCIGLAHDKKRCELACQRLQIPE